MDDHPSVKHIEECLNHLYNNDVESAYYAYKKVPLGGNGTFNDRYIKSNQSQEHEWYINDVFQALIYYWWNMMNSSVVEAPNKFRLHRPASWAGLKKLRFLRRS